MKINEIYKSVQGESTHIGRPCVFIRTTGCDLRCTWCDTSHAFYEGTEMTIQEITDQIQSLRCGLVEITGGEPLLQEEVFPLTTQLLDRGYEILIETSGAHSIEFIDRRATVIVDIKCPGSGMSESFNWDNLSFLKKNDEIKFVIADFNDFQWASSVVLEHSIMKRCTVLFSPVFGKLNPDDLAQWILENHCPVRLNLQLHKYIWQPHRRGV